jgi:hypothetical protein
MATSEVDPEPFVRLDVRELNRIAEAIANADGEDFNEWTALRYRSLARAAVATSADCIRDRMAVLPKGGMHTRAGWMVSVFAGIAEVDTDDLDEANERARS